MGAGHNGFVLCSLERWWWFGCVLVMRGGVLHFFFFLGVIMVDFCDDFIANLDGFELWSWRPVVMGEFGLWNKFFLGLWVVSLYAGRT